MVVGGCILQCRVTSDCVMSCWCVRPVQPAANNLHKPAETAINRSWRQLLMAMPHPHTGRSIIDHCYYAAVVILDLHYTLVKLTDTGRDAVTQCSHVPLSCQSISPLAVILSGNVQMYHFRNTGPRIMPPQQSSRSADGTGDPNGDMLNPDGTIRSGKKRKLHDNVATSYVALPMNAATALVASARCKSILLFLAMYTVI